MVLKLKKLSMSCKEISTQPQDEAYVDILQLLALSRSDLLKMETIAGIILQEDIIKNTGLENLIKKNSNKNCKVAGFKMQNKDCFAVYSNDSNLIPLYCLKIMETDNQLIIVEQSTIQKENVIQISALATNLIALLLNDAVEIWNTSSNSQPVQRIPIVMAKQMEVGIKNDVMYMAVISTPKENSLHYGAVELFCAVKNNLTFHHFQTINCIHPIQLKFAFIEQSNDLLLYILSSRYDQPLIVFQHKGIAGFEQIVSASTLPGAIEMHVLKLTSTGQHLIALLGTDKVTFVEVLLKNF